MQYAMRQPNSVEEATEIIAEAVSVLYQQIEFHNGKRSKAWNGDFVAHLKDEAERACAWLRSRPRK
jgi:hypothetical protein